MCVHINLDTVFDFGCVSLEEFGVAAGVSCRFRVAGPELNDVANFLNPVATKMQPTMTHNFVMIHCS